MVCLFIAHHAVQAKSLATTEHKSFLKAKAKLKAKVKDAKKEKAALRGLYAKRLKQKAGEICMIRKIQCMVAKFNGEAELQKRYCGVCTEGQPAEMATSRLKSVTLYARKPEGTAVARRLQFLQRRAALRQRRLRNKEMQQ